MHHPLLQEVQRRFQSRLNEWAHCVSCWCLAHLSLRRGRLVGCLEHCSIISLLNRYLYVLDALSLEELTRREKRSCVFRLAQCLHLLRRVCLKTVDILQLVECFSVGEVLLHFRIKLVDVVVLLYARLRALGVPCIGQRPDFIEVDELLLGS